ncbi:MULTISPECIES: hypothetical protein [Alkalihalophilus]|uniref:Uncharacterized protein n=1 Tax=Alkalihalophilus pseudofirmus (strain ATCC BAA-2126 / JCM 17055 / OF4) TaxID=398511 RepID=D3G1J7_ALKPO|nr:MULTISPECIES: hypothetical protein [Alkalihalophilus]ADC52223.1 hypothetical protein BpOF4_21139 [Alkalihalophilus pseudofirmus OF4]MEC2074367.1 hypothetical protein [Alkalihalophilus marmarensis]
MPNPVSFIASFFIAIAVMVVFPLYQLLDRQEDQAQILAQTATVSFVDSVRNKGYITPNMYEEYFQLLHSSGYTFDIEIEHQAKSYHPVYEDPANPSTFTGEYIVTYDHYYNSQILEILFPDNTLQQDNVTRRYELIAGDFINVRVKNSTYTPVSILRDAVTNHASDDPTSIHILYGGMVHNEDY